MSWLMNVSMRPIAASKRETLLSRARRPITIAATGAVALALLTGCGSDAKAGADSPNGERPFVVGAALGLTGAVSSMGEREKHAIEAYADALNARGGVNGHPVELVILDTQTDESVAVNQFRRLATQDNVDVILGPSTSGESLAVKPIAEESKVPFISLASENSIVSPPEDSQYSFKTSAGGDIALRAQLTVAAEQGWDRIGLLYANNAYGQEASRQAAKVAAETDQTIVASEAFDIEATDTTAQLSKLKAEKVDVVLVWATNPANAVVSKSAESIGMEAALLHSPGAGTDEYISMAGSAAEGTYVLGTKSLVPTSVAQDDPQYETVHDFVTVWEKAFPGELPSQQHALGWDGMLILENALKSLPDSAFESTDAMRNSIRDSLEKNTDRVMGANAVFTFTPQFHAQTGVEGNVVYRVEGGSFVPFRSF